MVYIDIQEYDVNDVVLFFNGKMENYIFIMIYSYRNSKKVNNDDIIKINNYSQVLKSCFINSIILNHIGKDYNDFLIYKFIIDDIKYYKPKYLYVISKFNINVDKLLENSKCNLERCYLK
jgi:hypothetical protein